MGSSRFWAKFGFPRVQTATLSSKRPKSGSKRLLARIWPRKAFSQGSQKQISIASWQAQIAQIWLPRVLAKIWPKKAFSQGSQKQISIVSWQAQIAQIWLRKGRGQDLAQKGFLPRFPEANFKSQLASPKCPNLAPKGSWLGFGPERLSPKVPRSKFQ